MEKIRIIGVERLDIIESLRRTWDINKPYWYPLFPCNRDDIVAFDSGYINNKKVGDILKILDTFNTKVVFELRDNGILDQIENFKDYNFWESDDYFWNNEGYWFDDSFKWIIYLSHEQTMTFGGKEFIQMIKKCWADWNHHLKWDTKNSRT